VVATNAAGTGVGSVMTFAVGGGSSIVTTGPPNAVTSSSSTASL
jgi:hypothetical protein